MRGYDRYRLAAATLGLALGAAVSAAGDVRVHTVRPGDGVQVELQALLTEALPGDVVRLQEGVYRFDRDLMISTKGITIQGAGPEKTRLSFAGQTSGSKGIEVAADSFVIEDLAIEDTLGNAIKIIGASGVTVRRVRVEWTRGPDPRNGAYGIYPVECENVLIEECTAIGASDAGIYVGQSRDVVVRRCRAERNVVGIEIENTVGADVHDCVSTRNTGGILVVDLPGLQLVNGERVRVFKNVVLANNLENFAPPGNIVGDVPPGSGILVIATDRVEVFENRVGDHDTASISVISYLATGTRYSDPRYDPYPEGIFIHDNVLSGGGRHPRGSVGERLAPLLGGAFPEIFYDGIVNPARLEGGVLPARFGLRLEDNGDATFANVNLHLITPEAIAAGEVRIERDPRPYTGTLEALPPVELRPHQPATAADRRVAAYFRQAPRELSRFALFEGNGASQEPAEGVVPYDVSTELFADYMLKLRFVRVPVGKRIAYRERGVLDFPAGTILVKTFAAPIDMTDPSSGRRLVETRLLVREPDGWYGLPYIWNEEQTEARLALGGGGRTITWKHSDGTMRTNEYVVPSANQCRSCHELDGRLEPLGPSARNLNRSYRYPAGAENQLAHWSAAGILAGAPDPASAPRLPRFDRPEEGSVEERARGWLDVNCAHCHNPLGSARTTGLDLRLEQKDPAKLGIWKPPVAAGRGAGELEYDIVPGEPEKSIVVFRIASTEPGIMMPELPRRLVPREGLALVEEWIRRMQPR